MSSQANCRAFGLGGSTVHFCYGKLLPRHSQLDHHSFVPLVVDQEVAMEEKAAILLEVCARDGLAPRTLGVKRRSPQHNVLAVEGAVALTDRHRRLSRVVPYGCEAVRLRVETRDSRARALGAVRVDEDEIGLQKLAVLDHVLLARYFRHDGLAICGEECLHDIPVACE